MVPGTRMFRVLVYLTTSTICLIFVLSWIHSTQRRWYEAQIERRQFDAARSAVGSVGALPVPAWQTIQVVVGKPGPATSPAGREPGAAHFTVDPLGHVSETRLWREQIALPRAPGAVRVRIAEAPGDTFAPQRQRFALRGLVRAIREWVRAGRERNFEPDRWALEQPRVRGRAGAVLVSLNDLR